MLWMCYPLFYIGKYVVINSGFFIANGIVALEAKLVYDVALIKKRQYWPKIVPRDLINRHFADKDVGDAYMMWASIEDSKLLTIFSF